MFETYVLRAFMYIEEMSYTMPRSVQIIAEYIPQVTPGENIDLIAARALRENAGSDTYMTFQYECVVSYFFVGEWPQNDGAGDVGRPVEILGPRVDEYESFGFQQTVAFGRGAIMYDSSMFPITGYCTETLTFI